mgnify:CR=1 FL=1|jgi:hypothetical protein|tara:strand:+ start:496 stop:687 length:192 start_codon:yes stop_codon:yes gene_type:complete
MDINKIISIVRTLNEEGMTLGSGQIAGTHEAGDLPPVRKRNKKTYAKGGLNSRKWWLQYLRNK